VKIELKYTVIHHSKDNDMGDLILPEFIDLSTTNLLDLGTPVTYVKEKPASTESQYMKEYESESHTLIMKSTILNQITLIQEIDDSEYKTVNHQMYNILKNMLILHGSVISRMPTFITEIENCMTLIELSYSRYVIHKMINNLRNGVHKDNIHFRESNTVVSNIPPMTVEERMAIEEKLPQFRYSRQIKKKQKPFNVGEIVGAKDKENKWWLARVLHRHDASDSPDHWYYIRFENCDAMHDEWISSKTYRVRYFNPKKHFLKRRRIIVH
jgi:hypothetical protein